MLFCGGARRSMPTPRISLTTAPGKMQAAMRQRSTLCLCCVLVMRPSGWPAWHGAVLTRPAAPPFPLVLQAPGRRCARCLCQARPTAAGVGCWQGGGRLDGQQLAGTAGPASAIQTRRRGGARPAPAPRVRPHAAGGQRCRPRTRGSAVLHPPHPGVAVQRVHSAEAQHLHSQW